MCVSVLYKFCYHLWRNKKYMPNKVNCTLLRQTASRDKELKTWHYKQMGQSQSARHEAARRRKSEWKVNLGSRNSVRSIWQVAWKSLVRNENTSTIPEVMDFNTLNFKPNFKFSGFKFFGGPPSHHWVCASKVWSISSACKNLRGQHPLTAEM